LAGVSQLSQDLSLPTLKAAYTLFTPSKSG